MALGEGDFSVETFSEGQTFGALPPVTSDEGQDEDVDNPESYSEPIYLDVLEDHTPEDEQSTEQ